MRIAIIDGMGGGVGSQVIEIIKLLNNKDIDIIALGTNSQATTNMIKSGAHKGATGENAILWTCKSVDLIIGPLAIIAANSMMGEISPKISEAISSSPAKKLLLPLSKCNIHIIGLENVQFKTIFNQLEVMVKNIIEKRG